MKFRNALKRYGAKIPAAVGTGLLVLGTSAHAALPTEVTAQTTAAKADINEAGALGIGIFLAIMIFMWLRRVMR